MGSGDTCAPKCLQSMKWQSCHTWLSKHIKHPLGMSCILFCIRKASPSELCQYALATYTVQCSWNFVNRTHAKMPSFRARRRKKVENSYRERRRRERENFGDFGSVLGQKLAKMHVSDSLFWDFHVSVVFIILRFSFERRIYYFEIFIWGSFSLCVFIIVPPPLNY